MAFITVSDHVIVTESFEKFVEGFLSLLQRFMITSPVAYGVLSPVKNIYVLLFYFQFF